jgi:hypothetical protein
MKNLLILLLLLPTLSFAGVCNVRVYINEPALNSYLEEIESEMTSLKCKKNDVLNLELGDARNATNSAKGVIFDAMAKYCDMNKSVIHDLSNLNYNLVCSIRKLVK